MTDCLGGDFNEIRHLEECEGRGVFDRLGASEFNDVV